MTTTAPKSFVLPGPFRHMFEISRIHGMFDGGQSITGLNVPPGMAGGFPFQVGDCVMYRLNSMGRKQSLMLSDPFGYVLDEFARTMGELGTTIVFKRGRVVMRALITPAEGQLGKLEFHAASIVPDSEIYSDVQPLPLTTEPK